MVGSTFLRACLFVTGLLESQLVIAEESYGCAAGLSKPVEWDAKPGEIKLFKVNDRVVRVSVPATYNKTRPSPMIIGYHDKDQPMEHFEYEGQWTDPDVNKDYIMAYPEADNVRYRLLSLITELTVSGTVDVGHKSSEE
jgi:hypothetical protein